MYQIRKLCGFALLVLATFTQRVNGSIVYPDFETSMLREVHCLNRAEKDVQKRKKLYDSADKNTVGRFKDLYARNVDLAQQDGPNEEYRIPRIVHQIWLGGQVPQKFHQWMSTWASLQGWEYKLWTDEDVKELNLYNQALYDQSSNYGEKSDILRLEILYEYGGVYADVDYECFNRDVLDELHRSFDFYIGFEPLEHGFVRFNMFKVCNALMASRAFHPLLKDLIINMQANYYAYRSCCGPVDRTGPSYLTRLICEYETTKTHHNRNMYLPSTFLYPYTEAELIYFQEHPDVCIEFFPETVGIHYWSGSWNPHRSLSTSIKQINSYEGWSHECKSPS